MAKIHPAIAGHVMEENDKLRELLRDCRMIVREVGYPKLAASIDAALSQQAEPTYTYTAVDMATAAAQGFRDGQAAVEQAAVQDEQPAVFWVLFDATGPYGSVNWASITLMVVGSVVGWGLVTNTMADFTLWQGYLLGPLGGKEGAWAYANLGVLVAILIGFLGYWALCGRRVRDQA